MSLRTETLYRERGIVALRLLETAGHNPTIRFDMDLTGCDPFEDLVLQRGDDRFRVHGNPLTPEKQVVEGCSAYLHTPSIGLIVLLTSVRHMDALYLEDWRVLAEEDASKARTYVHTQCGMM